MIQGQSRASHGFFDYCSVLTYINSNRCNRTVQMMAHITAQDVHQVTCELITCIEAGVCDCERPFKAVTSVGKKWGEGGVRQWITHKVHSTAWQHKHDPKLLAPPPALEFNPDSVTAIEDQWNARAKTGFKRSGERKQKKTTRRIKLPEQENKLPFKPTA